MFRGTVINHPAKTRRKFWVKGSDGSSAESWQESAALTEGSWWPHWLEWLDQNNPAERGAPAKSLGNRKYKPLADAPGTYVLEGEG